MSAATPDDEADTENDGTSRGLGQALADRLAFLGLTAEDQARLAPLAAALAPQLPATLDRLYARIGMRPALAALFAGPASLAQARAAQAGHWAALLSGSIGEPQARRAHAAGEMHARLGLEPRWYLGAYAQVLADAVSALVRGRLEGIAAPDVADALAADLSALIRTAMLDADLGLSAYFAAAQRAEREAAAAKSRFLATMSHEIRTPLNGVLGVLSLLRREPLPAETVRLLIQAEDCGAMLLQMINDTLDASKIEARRLTLDPEPMSPVQALEAVAAMLRPQAEAKGVALETRVEGDDAWVCADPVRFRQMLFNLIGNAVKFTDTGQVEARLAIGPADATGGRAVRVAVADTGVGVAEADLAGLFQPFTQAPAAGGTRRPGTGLGLSITRSLAELMGGGVGASSTLGLGSTFWFEITAPAAEPPPSSAAVLADFSGYRFLVVDDNPTNRLVAGKVLEALGGAVETADDGDVAVAAVAAAGAERFDVVLMDVHMPRMDGLEATRAIRALPGPASRSIVVGLTAHAEDEGWGRFRKAGMDSVVGKPFTPSDLAAGIAEALRRRMTRG